MTPNIKNTVSPSKTISIFGSTGSVGEKTFNIAMNLGYKISAITCNKNHKLAISQAEAANVEYIGVACPESYKTIKDYFANNKSVNVIPHDNITEISRIRTDICCMSIISPKSYLYTYEALKYTKRLAISSKEAIITLGKLLISEAQKYNTEIIPVDSEHSSLFQCLKCTNLDSVQNLTITASGGGLRNLDEKDLSTITISEALQHPTWKMGKKITIDCSTMMNKAIEILEAAILFDFNIDAINTLIHPQSIIHAIVTLKNKGQIASMYNPDMSIPISYSLTYPYLSQQNTTKHLNLADISRLDFYDMKPWQKRSIDIAKEAYKNDKTIALNSANDYAVNAFLSGQIKFNDIWRVIENLLSKCNHNNISLECIDSVINEYNAISKAFIYKYCS